MKILTLLLLLINACGPERLCLQSLQGVGKVKITIKENACIWMDTYGALTNAQKDETILDKVWKTHVIIHPSREALQELKQSFKEDNVICFYDTQTDEAHVVAEESLVYESCLPHELAHAWKYKTNESVAEHDKKWKQYDNHLRIATQPTRK